MGYLNGLANEMGGSTNKIRKELNHLQEAGYLNKVKNENIVEYTANTKHPLYEVLRKVVMKHLGLEDIVDNVLEKMGNVEEIILVVNKFDAELNILSPLAANTELLNLVVKRTASVELFVCGTI